MMHTPTLTPGEGIRLPHRVTVKTVRSAAQNLASYQCPGCGKKWPTNRTLVNHLAHWHATTCADLRAINRRALACWNCDGTGPTYSLKVDLAEVTETVQAIFTTADEKS